VKGHIANSTSLSSIFPIAVKTVQVIPTQITGFDNNQGALDLPPDILPSPFNHQGERRDFAVKKTS
jgi:hypothetical protein